MPDVPIPPSIADTPLGERLAWALAYLRDGGPELTDAEIEEHFTTDAIPVEFRKAAITSARASLGHAELRDVRSPGPLFAMAEMESDGEPWELGLRIESVRPHRIRNLIGAKLVPGVTIRDATEADAAALRAIELHVPIIMGETRVVYDRGEDYFAPERLMGNAVTHVVEMEGRPVGLAAWVEHDARVKGTRLRAGFKHRQRLLPEARGQGLRQMQDSRGGEAAWQQEVFYTYAAAGNANVRHIYRPSEWTENPERLVIDTAQNRGPETARRAKAADSARIVELLNAAHGREEMYVPYTTDSLAERLGREPTLYSWPQFRMGERAVLGTWPAHLKVIRTTPEGTTTDDRALVLDYGYEDGAQDEFVELVQAECAELAASGRTELAIFVARQQAVYARLAAMAKRIEPYVLFLYISPPPDLAERGVYVDQLYF